MDVFSLAAKITLDTNEYENALGEASTKTHSFGEKLKSGLATAAKVGVGALTAASAAVGAFSKSSIDAGMQFDSAMSQVAAVSGATGEDFDQLREKAMDMGASTKFSASEAAEAMNYMAMAGWKAEDMLGGIEGIMNLAAASGEDLALTSDIVTDALTAFGLSAEDSGHFADILAAASSNANTNVSMLGESFKYVAPVAGALGYSAEDTSIALGLMANSGIKASQAGTALRTALTNMVSPTDDMAVVMEKYGLSLTDADGNMLSFSEVMEQLRDKMGGLDEATQASAASTLFGKEAMSGMLAVINASDSDFNKLTQAIYKSDGAASGMAKTMQDNLAGDITIFKSALEGAQIVLSDQLTPSLREFTQFGSDAISNLSMAFQEGGLPSAMDTLGTILSDGLNMVIKQLPVMVDAGMQLLSAVGRGLIDNLPVITDAALQIVTMLATGMISALPDIASSAVEIITALVGGISEQLPTLVPVAVDAVLQLATTLTDPDNLSNMVDSALQLITSLADGIINALPTLIEKAPVIIENLVTAISKNLPKIIKAGIELIVKLAVGVIQAIPKLVKAVPEIIGSFIAGIADYYGNLINVGEELVGKIGEGIKDLAAGAAQWGSDLIDNFIQGITGAIGKVKEAVSNVAGAVADFLGFSEPEEGPLSNFHTYAPDMMQLFARGIDDNAGLIEDSFNRALDFKRDLDFGTASVDFASSSLGVSSAGIVNGVSGAVSATGNTAPMTFNLVLPDGTRLASYLLDPLAAVAKANGTPILNPT